MGMFDCIIFTCPKCGKQAEDQTKSGPCCMYTYDLDKEMTIEDAVVVNGMAVECYHCGHTFEIIADLPGNKIKVRIEGENHEG